MEQLLPLEAEDSQQMKHHWDYIYEPDAKELLERLLTRYIESQVYQSVVENGACEQAARMLAMKNATENAGELIDDLQLIYNKARQAAITQELSEIVERRCGDRLAPRPAWYGKRLRLQMIAHLATLRAKQN